MSKICKNVNLESIFKKERNPHLKLFKGSETFIKGNFS